MLTIAQNDFTDTHFERFLPMFGDYGQFFQHCAESFLRCMRYQPHDIRIHWWLKTVSLCYSHHNQTLVSKAATEI